MPFIDDAVFHLRSLFHACGRPKNKVILHMPLSLMTTVAAAAGPAIPPSDTTAVDIERFVKSVSITRDTVDDASLFAQVPLQQGKAKWVLNARSLFGDKGHYQDDAVTMVLFKEGRGMRAVLVTETPAEIDDQITRVRERRAAHEAKRPVRAQARPAARNPA